MQAPASPFEQIETIFNAQHATALALRSSTAAQRAGKLKALADALLSRRETLYEAFAADFRKPPAEVESTELLPVIEEVRHAVRQLRRWMKPRRVSATWPTLGTRSRIEYQPRGRCLILGPWNYPVNTVLCPLVSAVAAGNAVILKPSELTPHVSEVLRQIVAAVFDRHEVAVIPGGVETAQKLLALPFDHVFFTGSTAVGKVVMKAAAEHLGSVTLELGGQSPVVIDESADLARAAQTVMWGKLINAGQSCVAPDHVYVHHTVHQAFVQHCVDVVRQRFGPGATDRQNSPDLARIINERHTRRIDALVQQAVQTGAHAPLGGETRADASADPRYIAPTVLTGLPPDALILGEEIFGPVLPVVGYERLDDVIEQINARPKPLALYLWSTCRSTVDHVLQNTSSGGVCVNHCMLHYVQGQLPFGGVNHSGMGSTHGHFGFKAFSHERGVLVGGPLMMTKVMFPPYTPFKTGLTRRLVDALRWLC